MYIQGIGPTQAHDRRLAFTCKRCGIRITPRDQSGRIFDVHVSRRHYGDDWNLDSWIQVCDTCIEPFRPFIALSERLERLQKAYGLLVTALEEVLDDRKAPLIGSLLDIVREVTTEFETERDRVTPLLLDWYPGFVEILVKIEEREQVWEAKHR